MLESAPFPRDENGNPDPTPEHWAEALAVQIAWGLEHLIEDEAVRDAICELVVAGVKAKPEVLEVLVGSELMPESYFDELDDWGELE